MANFDITLRFFEILNFYRLNLDMFTKKLILLISTGQH